MVQALQNASADTFNVSLLHVILIVARRDTLNVSPRRLGSCPPRCRDSCPHEPHDTTCQQDS
jgi:hypothetical protein